MTSLKASLRPVQAALLAVIASAVGLQWASLQLLACAGMTLTNAQSMTLPEAIEKAVSGKEACALCLFIREKRTTSDGEETVILHPVYPTEGVFRARERLLDVPNTSYCFIHDTFIIHSGDTQAPPRPPPRATV